MHIDEFDYHLPKQLIAQYPAEKRDRSRLLVVDRSNNKISYSSFEHLTDFISPGDCMVLNDTKVKAARVIGKVGEKEIDILLARRTKKNNYFVKAKPGRKLKDKVIIDFAQGKYKAVCHENPDAFKQQMKHIEFLLDEDIETVLDDFGLMPLPPYIKRKVGPKDSLRYQTVYAKNSGAIASPTAGLHFTEDVFKCLEEKGISRAFVTLHVGLGTFLPVKVDDITEHEMHSEAFELTESTARKIENIKNQGKRICAIGTTVCRVLESCAQDSEGFSLSAGIGDTDIFIYPPYRFKAVDVLLTNFHLPKTTLLMLVSAFAGKDLIMEAYKQAVEKEYRFFSYGDAMLIL